MNFWLDVYNDAMAGEYLSDLADAREAAQLGLYEDLTDDRSITSDPEGTLVLLCSACAARHGDAVYLQERNVDYGACEECGARGAV